MKQDDKGKIRVIVFEVEGNNSSLQESLRSVVNVLTRNSQPHNRTPVARPALPSESLTETMEDTGEGELVVEQYSQAEAREPRKVRKVPSYKLVPDLNFEDGDQGLNEYAGEKNPKTEFDRLLVVGGWLKSKRGIEAITADHVYTAYGFMATHDKSWACPRNITGLFSDSKRRKKFFDKGPDLGTWKITHIGESALGRMGTE